MSKYHQGKFKPTYSDKYVGDIHNIFYRSSWEKKMMIFFDTNPSILRWMSEELAIPYVSPMDGKLHRYFPDFLIEVRQKSGETKKILVEIKPKAQCSLPKAQKRQTKRMINEIATYAVNSSKWIAARKWCTENNVDEFMILTEDQLFGNKLNGNP